MLRTIGVRALPGFIILVGGLAGCTTAEPHQPAPASDRASPGLTLDRAAGASGSDGTAAVVGGSAIPWASLRPALTEAAGGLVLEEFALDRMLEREAARRGLTVGEAEIAAEETALLDELAGVVPEPLVAGEAPDQRWELLDRVRRQRGLGPTRYGALLRRNALLRALVRDTPDASVSPEELELARRLAVGPTRRVRLFVSRSETRAAAFREAVAAAPARQRPWEFADRAARESEHPSAPRGGLIERLHPDDPAYPDLIGDAAEELEAGGLSPVLATASGFAVLLVEGVNPARTPGQADTERIERRLVQRKQRIAMERKARDLLGAASVSPVDPDLARAWRQRP
jgi:hypothetical protein